MFGDQSISNELADKIELGLRGGREADFNLPEAYFYQQLEKLKLLRDIHGHGECLITVTQVNAAPDWRSGNALVRPLPVGKVNRRKRAVFFKALRFHGFFEKGKRDSLWA